MTLIFSQIVWMCPLKEGACLQVALNAYAHRVFLLHVAMVTIVLMGKQS